MLARNEDCRSSGRRPACRVGAAAGLPAAAQTDQGPFGGFKHDRTAPIEITSDALEVRQAENLAIFSGEVVAGQGTLRLTADRIDVAYDEAAEGDAETGAIRNMQAQGNVFISNGAETAQGEQAEYDVELGPDHDDGIGGADAGQERHLRARGW